LFLFLLLTGVAIGGSLDIPTSASGSPEGVEVLSTGEAGGTKFLREDGDGKSSWQTVTSESGGTVTEVAFGDGMTFSTFSDSGTITMGTPSTINASSINSVSTDTHAHLLDSAFSEINWDNASLPNNIEGWVADDYVVFINLKRGITWNETLTIGTSGVSGSPITIQPYEEGADPIIDGGGVRSQLIVGVLKYYITIDSIVCTDASESGSHAAIDINGGSEFILKNMTVHDNAGKFGIHVYGEGDGKQVIDSEVYNQTYSVSAGAHDHHGDGIAYGGGAGGDYIITGNKLHHNEGTGLIAGMDGVSQQDGGYIAENEIYLNEAGGILAWRIENTIIEYNHVYENGQVYNDWYSIDLLYGGDNNTVRYNRVHDMNHVSSDSGGIRFDGGTPWVEFGSGNVVHGNIIYNSWRGIHILANTEGSEVYNNTIYNSAYESIVLDGGEDKDGVIIKNNIIFGATTQYLINISSSVNTVSDSNLFFDSDFTDKYFMNGVGTYSSLTEWTAGTGLDTNSLEADPQFTDAPNDNFIQLPISPAISSGALLLGYELKLNPDSEWVSSVSTFYDPYSIGAYAFLGQNVTKVGTPVDDQVGVWTGDGTIEGTAGLAYDGTNLIISGDGNEIKFDDNATVTTDGAEITYGKGQVNTTKTVILSGSFQTYTVSNADFALFMNNDTDHTSWAQLPAGKLGKMFYFKNLNVNVLTVLGADPEKVEGETGYALAFSNSVFLVFDGTEWKSMLNVTRESAGIVGNNITVVAGNYVVTGSHTVTLHATDSVKGDKLRIKAKGGTVTVDPGALEIDGSTTDLVLAQWESLGMLYDGTDWNILYRYTAPIIDGSSGADTFHTH